MVAIADFVGEGDDELTFKKGDVILFVERDDNNWIRGECEQRVGWFPGTHVQPLPGAKTNPINTDAPDPAATPRYNHTTTLHHYHRHSTPHVDSLLDIDRTYF